MTYRTSRQIRQIVKWFFCKCEKAVVLQDRNLSEQTSWENNTSLQESELNASFENLNFEKS